LNKFLLVDNDTLMRVKKKIDIEGEIVDKIKHCASRIKLNARIKNIREKEDVQKQCARYLNDKFAETLMSQDVVNIEKSH